MKKDLLQPLVDLQGRPMQAKESAEGTVAAQLAIALYAYGNNNDKATPEKKYRAWKIAQAIGKDPAAVEITAEDITICKEAANAMFTAGWYGQIVDALEA